MSTGGGTCKSPGNRASTRGVIGDARGNWIKGLTINLCSCTITKAELRGLFEGLAVTWSLSIRTFIVEVDSLYIVDLVNCDSGQNKKYSPLTKNVKQLLSLNWQDHLAHVYPKTNYVADHLAAYG